MNPEILKQIIVAVNGIAGGAKEAFGYYLLAAYGVELVEFILGWACGLILAWMILNRLLRPLVSNLRSHAYLCSIRDRLDIGCYGPMMDSEFQEVRKKIEEALNKGGTK